MKKWVALILVLSLLLCGCSKTPAEPVTEPSVEAVTEAATEPTTEPTEPPTTEPPVYIHPLNGETSDTPFTNRIFATTISNIRDALPHVSVNEADILMEMFVNASVVRCIALFSDISQVDAIGSVRSTRPMFNDICAHYNAILAHAGGTGTALRNAEEHGITHYNIDSLMRRTDEPLKAGTAYRDKEYKHGEHNLFAIGSGLVAYAESEGQQVTGLPETDYGLIFAEDGTPADGEPTESIKIRIRYNNTKKDTIMKYDAETGRYTYWQYDKMMVDQITEEPETFENVVVMFAEMTTMRHNYHVADFLQGGEGFFACNGKIIPMVWTCAGDNEPFRFFTEAGEPLAFGVGNTYIAISSPTGEVTWTAPKNA